MTGVLFGSSPQELATGPWLPAWSPIHKKAAQPIVKGL